MFQSHEQDHQHISGKRTLRNNRLHASSLQNFPMSFRFLQKSLKLNRNTFLISSEISTLYWRAWPEDISFLLCALKSRIIDSCCWEKWRSIKSCKSKNHRQDYKTESIIKNLASVSYLLALTKAWIQLKTVINFPILLHLLKLFSGFVIITDSIEICTRIGVSLQSYKIPLHSALH